MCADVVLKEMIMRLNITKTKGSDQWGSRTRVGS